MDVDPGSGRCTPGGRCPTKGCPTRKSPGRTSVGAGGHPPLGFRRAGDRHLLEVDPDTIGTAVGLFERYALGTVSAKQLASETGLADTRIRMILTDRRRGPTGRLSAADTRGLRAWARVGDAGTGCNGAPDRIRTCDLRLRRPTLYPLSYRRASPYRSRGPAKRTGGKSSERLPKEPLRCCPGEGAIRRGGTPSAIASRASITSAAPTTLTLPTHDLDAGAAGRSRSADTVPRECVKAKGFLWRGCVNSLTFGPQQAKRPEVGPV